MNDRSNSWNYLYLELLNDHFTKENVNFYICVLLVKLVHLEHMCTTGFFGAPSKRTPTPDMYYLPVYQAKIRLFKRIWAQVRGSQPKK